MENYTGKKCETAVYTYSLLYAATCEVLPLLVTLIRYLIFPRLPHAGALDVLIDLIHFLASFLHLLANQ